MSGQSIIRLISVVLLQGMLYYELFGVQSESLRWYEWVILVILTIGLLFSVIGECSVDEDDKSEYKDYYFVVRIINTVILCGLLWKTCSIQSELPVSLTWALFAVLGVGLFSVFNFLYYLIALLTTGGVFFILRHTSLEGFWQYLVIAGVIAIGIGAMIGIMIAIAEKKAAERRAERERIARIKAEREAEEARRRARSSYSSGGSGSGSSIEGEIGKGFLRGVGKALADVLLGG